MGTQRVLGKGGHDMAGEQARVAAVAAKRQPVIAGRSHGGGM